MSPLERSADVIARRMSGWVVRNADPVDREWASAMNAEIDAIEGGFARLRWALSGVRMLARDLTPGGRRHVGSVGRSALSMVVFVLAISAGQLTITPDDGWIAAYLVFTLSTTVWWLVSLALRVIVLSYASAGQAVFSVVTLCAHLIFGIDSVQGGVANFSVMGAATLAALFGARIAARRRSPFALLGGALLAVILNEGLWIAGYGFSAYRGDIASHFAIIAAALLGAGAGLVNFVRFGDDRPLTRGMEV
jgi:hypothetical protein